uniref:Zinc transporter 2-like n=1 Tax=Dermatophagoides pteronyssinus TaxID=6956 RepID=A0A6P6Y7J2_DERPT|nr:zinc transporter 2-like [Dermatophagoides pteronyssinus]
MKNKNPFEYQTMSDEDDDDDEEEESCDGNSSDRNVNIENNQTTTTTQQQQLSINNHCHDLQMDNNQRKFARQAMIKLIITLIISMMFMIIEIVGGYLSHSLAIFTDAAHLFSDLISFAISLIAIYLAQKSPTRSKSFGYLRLEVIGVLFSVFLIWFLTGLLIYFAINRIISNEFEIDSITMMTVSSIGLAFNLVMWLTLSSKCCCHSINDEKEDQETNGHHHSHNHNQHNHQQHGHSHINMNVRAAILHIIGDCIQSIGVIIASIIIHFRPDWKLADPICTLLFAGLVFTTTYSIMKDSLHILMEGFPNEYQYEQVKQMLLEQIPGVKNVHSLHIWSLTHGRNVLAVHLTVDYPDDDNTDDHNDRNQFELIREKAEILIRSKLQISLTTIQIEYHRPDMIQNCSHCIGPKT